MLSGRHGRLLDHPRGRQQTSLETVGCRPVGRPSMAASQMYPTIGPIEISWGTSETGCCLVDLTPSRNPTQLGEPAVVVTRKIPPRGPRRDVGTPGWVVAVRCTPQFGRLRFRGVHLREPLGSTIGGRPLEKSRHTSRCWRGCVPPRMWGASTAAEARWRRRSTPPLRVEDPTMCSHYSDDDSIGSSQPIAQTNSECLWAPNRATHLRQQIARDLPPSNRLSTPVETGLVDAVENAEKSGSTCGSFHPAFPL